MLIKIRPLLFFNLCAGGWGKKVLWLRLNFRKKQEAIAISKEPQTFLVSVEREALRPNGTNDPRPPTGDYAKPGNSGVERGFRGRRNGNRPDCDYNSFLNNKKYSRSVPRIGRRASADFSLSTTDFLASPDILKIMWESEALRTSEPTYLYFINWLIRLLIVCVLYFHIWWSSFDLSSGIAFDCANKAQEYYIFRESAGKRQNPQIDRISIVDPISG